MLKEQGNIDSIFKNGLDDYSESPPAYVWDSVNASLDKQRKQGKLINMWRSIAAASIAILMIVSFSLFNNTDPLSMQSEQSSQLASGEKTGDSSVNEDSNINYSDADGIEYDADNTNDNFNSDTKSKYTLLARSADKAEAENIALSEQRSSELEYLQANKNIVLASNNYVLNPAINTGKSTKESTKKEYYPLYAESTSVVRTKKKTKLSIGGMVSPSYSSPASTGSNVDAMNAKGYNINESGISSLGGGIQLKVERGSRWSFETGVMYAAVGQQVSGGFDSNPPVNSSSAYAGDMLENSIGKISLNKLKTPPVAPGAASSNADILAYNAATQADALKQTLEYIEVPVMARYSLFEHFPYISIAGGLSSNFLVGNTAFLVDGGEQQEIGKTESIRPVVMSSSLGIGLGVPITKTLKINVEPRFKYFLNSLSSGGGTEYRPYSFGVFGGVTFVIK